MDSSGILPSQCDGNVPARGSNSLVSVGSFPQLVRGHSGREVVVLHDVLEVELGDHLKLKGRGESTSSMFR